MVLPEAQDPRGEVRALLGRPAMAGDGAHALERVDDQLCVGDGIISNKSPVRESRTPGSMSLERNRGQSGDRGTGTVAKAAGNSYSLHPRHARPSSPQC